ncbi:hypothetical protein HMPREF0208_03094 [Citrobacter koseri]|nr:hypothetical protein HMPREF3207_04764 [Citrobacter koseri]KXB42623.1 hypothetical protein HMPREF0208_03094 [Citrobacter koseri]
MEWLKFQSLTTVILKVGFITRKRYASFIYRGSSGDGLFCCAGESALSPGCGG